MLCSLYPNVATGFPLRVSSVVGKVLHVGRAGQVLSRSILGKVVYLLQILGVLSQSASIP